MNCDDCGDLIDGYCLETLDEGTRESVERHLRSGCPACRRQLESVCLAIADGIEPIEPPPQVKRELMERVRRGRPPAPLQKVSPGPSSRAADFTRRLLGPILAVAASVAGIIIGYQAVRHDQGPAANLRVDAPDVSLPGGGAGVTFAMASIPGEPAGDAAGGYVAFDQLAGQVHICATKLDPDTERLHVWITCTDGSDHELGELRPPEDGIVMQVFDLPPLPAPMRSLTISEVAGGPLEAGSGTPVLTVEIP